MLHAKFWRSDTSWGKISLNLISDWKIGRGKGRDRMICWPWIWFVPTNEAILCRKWIKKVDTRIDSDGDMSLLWCYQPSRNLGNILEMTELITGMKRGVISEAGFVCPGFSETFWHVCLNSCPIRLIVCIHFVGTRKRRAKNYFI